MFEESHNFLLHTTDSIQNRMKQTRNVYVYLTKIGIRKKKKFARKPV